MFTLPNIDTLSEAEDVLAKAGIVIDTVYQDVFTYTGYQYGMNRDTFGVHIYFNQGGLNKAYFTPSLRMLTIFDVPRQDSMLGEKHYFRRPAQQSVSAMATT